MDSDLAPVVTASMINIHDSNSLLQRRAFVKSLRPTSPKEIKKSSKKCCKLYSQLRKCDRYIKLTQLHFYPGYLKRITTYREWRRKVRIVFSCVYPICALNTDDLERKNIVLPYYALEAAAMFIQTVLDDNLLSFVNRYRLDDPIVMLLRLDHYFLSLPVPRGIMNEFHKLKRRRNESVNDFKARVDFFIWEYNINVKGNTRNRHFYDDLVSTSPW